jgi:hypothetical protein
MMAVVDALIIIYMWIIKIFKKKEILINRLMGNVSLTIERL